MDGGEWIDGGIIFWKSSRVIDLCVVGLVLSVASYFRVRDPRVAQMVDMLSATQQAGGCWQDDVKGTAGKEFHITLAVLEGLLERQRSQDFESPKVTKMIARGREFLARHRLYRSTDDHGVVRTAWRKFSFPPRWRYDVLRALDFFQDSRAPYDDRLEDPIKLLRAKRSKDGTWPRQNNHRGRVFFELEKVGQPSRFNTLRALRVLNWWEIARRVEANA